MEEYAILKALHIRLEVIENREMGIGGEIKEKKVPVITDSKTSIAKIRNRRIKTAQIMEIRWLLKKTNTEETETYIQWQNRKMTKKEIPQLDKIVREAAQNEEEENRRYIGMTKKEINAWKRKEKLRKWQERWTINNEQRQNIIGHIIPLIGLDRIGLTFKTTQLVTGHDNMKHYIKRLKLRQIEADCDCGTGEETNVHIMSDRQRVDRREIRVKIIDYLN